VRVVRCEVDEGTKEDNMERNNALAALLSTVASNDVVSAIDYTFTCMTIAEEEIAAAKRRYKRVAGRVNGAFVVLMPSAPLKGFSVELYRVHARELLERVARGQDTRLGTKAEVVALLSETSMKSPLTSDGYVLAAKLFRDLYPQLVHAPIGPEFHEGSTDEMFHEVARKCAVPERVCGPLRSAPTRTKGANDGRKQRAKAARSGA
jgi:hypothetical protein